MATIVSSTQFNAKEFDKAFSSNLKKLAKSEATTKQLLGDIANDVLAAVHSNGDVQPVNRLIEVLTPVNKKATTMFFQALSGFQYNDKEGKFGKKDKTAYETKLALAEDFLSSGATIWDWIRENVSVEAKPFDLSKVTSTVSQLLKKSEKEGLDRADVIRAIMAGGLTASELLSVLKESAEA